MAMPMPSPSSGHIALERMIGLWRGTEHVHPSPFAPQASTRDALVRNTRVLDGFAVVQEYAQSLGDSVVFRGHGVFRFDATSGHHHLYWFDSMGQAPS